MFKIKLLLILGILQSTLSYAWIVEDQCTNLKIQIINHSLSDCTLSRSLLLSGVIVHNSEAPQRVTSGEVSPWFVLSENNCRCTDFYGDPIHVLMQYDCGEGKMVAFSSQKSKCRRSSATANGIVLAEYNLDISPEFSDGIMPGNIPGIAVWTITDRQ